MSHRKLSDESSSSKFEDSNISSDECDQIDVESASSGSNRSSATSGVCSVNSHQNNDVINNESFRSSPNLEASKNEKDNPKKGNLPFSYNLKEPMGLKSLRNYFGQDFVAFFDRTYDICADLDVFNRIRQS